MHVLSLNIKYRDQEQFGMASEHEPAFEKNQIVGEYKIIRHIPGGGMGQVYAAEHVETGDKVAIKVCVDKDYHLRFCREVVTMARLPTSINLMRVITSNVDSDPPYFVMPLAEGSVEDEIGASGKDCLEPDRAVEIVLAVCDALSAIHNGGPHRLIHRDVKPANILIMPDGTIVLADFGLVKDIDTSQSKKLTRTGGIVGTPRYRSPEQLADPGKIDHRTDIFSLGLTLRELLTGSLIDDESEIDGAILGVIEKATKQAPGQRYQAVEDMRSELSEAIALLNTYTDASRTASKISELCGWDLTLTWDEKSVKVHQEDLLFVFRELRKLIRTDSERTLQLLSAIRLEADIWDTFILNSPELQGAFVCLMKDCADAFVSPSRRSSLNSKGWSRADALWTCYGALLSPLRSESRDVFGVVFSVLFYISTHYNQWSAMDRLCGVLKAQKANNGLSQKLSEAIGRDEDLKSHFLFHICGKSEFNIGEFNTSIQLVVKIWQERRSRMKTVSSPIDDIF